MKEQKKCAILRNTGRFTREHGHLLIDVDLVNSEMTCEVVGNDLVHIYFEDVVLSRLVDMFSLMSKFQNMTESEEKK